MTTKCPLQSIQTLDLLQEQLARLKAEFPDLFTNEGQLNPAELLRLTGQQGREHFDFQWWGKSKAKRKAFAPTTASLRYDEARSVNPDKAGGNAIIEGENLEVLKLLLCAYRGQVKCIYIDPPYNTGNDFVYKDNFAEDQQAYWEQTGVTQDGVKMSTNTKSDGRFHSNWLNMIYPRLLVARQLLREDGVIFVSIDDNEVTHLRKVMDEVFGGENALVTLIWDKQHSQQQGVFKNYHEYVICYAKNAELISKIEGGDGNIQAGALKKISKSNPASEFTFPKGVRFDAKDGTALSGTFGVSEKVDAQSVRDEVLLKCGFQLDVQLTPIAEVKANKLYRAQDQQILPREAIVCFDNQLDATTLEWLCLQKGQRVIVLEAALDTTGKWNLHHQLGDGLVVF